jgi:hypothetical protein
MAPRVRRGCRNCPRKPDAAKPQSTAPPRVLAISGESEGLRLWNHVLFGTGTCISMIEGYQASHMPGQPQNQIRQLIQRLQRVLQKFEEKDEGLLSTKPELPARQTDGGGGQLEVG